MLLLATIAQPTLERYASPHLGRLVQPRHYSSVHLTAAAGLPWAADNDAFGNFDARAYERMLDALAGLSGCLFVAAPDVVGDAQATLDLWHEWQPRLAERELPAALVAQNGLTSEAVPWAELAALFVGGASDERGREWKLGSVAEALAAEARARGKWTHLGRVNGLRRMIYANAHGYDSVDGSSWARWRDTWLPMALRHLGNGQQLRLEVEACA
jgi:hypothetical protein